MRPIWSETLRRSSWNSLVGKWTMTSPQFPGAQGATVFEWIEGGAILAFRSEAPEPAPASLWLIGADDSVDHCIALYSDSRGVSRVYQTRMVDGVWSIWRDAQPFSQRFEGHLDEHAETLRGAWHSSGDGNTWKRDFELIYTRTT